MPLFGAANGDAICSRRSKPFGRSDVPGASGTSINRNTRSSPSTFSGTRMKSRCRISCHAGRCLGAENVMPYTCPASKGSASRSSSVDSSVFPWKRATRTAGGEDVRDADAQRHAAPEIPVAAVEDDGQPFLSHRASLLRHAYEGAASFKKDRAAGARQPEETPAPPLLRRPVVASSGTDPSRRTRVARPETRTPPVPRPQRRFSIPFRWPCRR